MPIFRTQAANDNNRSARREELIRELLGVVQPLVCDAAVLEAFYPTAQEAGKRRRLLEKWRGQLDRSDRAAKRIHDWLERESWRLERGPDGRKGLWLLFDDKLGCYMIRQDQFHYASLANDGLHSGSGDRRRLQVPDHHPREALRSTLDEEGHQRSARAPLTPRQRAARRLLGALRSTTPRGVRERGMKQAFRAR